MSNGVEEKMHLVADWVAQSIYQTGCTVVYGGHGGALIEMVNAVCRHPHLTWVYGRNEHDAATMAAAHAKLTGKLGVVIATSGPGATNLTTGLMEAVMDQVPLLAITGTKPRDVIGYSEFQDVNQSRLFAAAGIEWSKDAASPIAVVPLLRDAVSTACTKRTAVHLAIPVDVQAAPAAEMRSFCARNAVSRLRGSFVDEQEIQLAVETLVGRLDEPHPRNIIAVGLRAAEWKIPLNDAIIALAEALDAPILTRLDAKGVVDERHPLSFGVIGVHGKPGLEQAANIISTSDLVICIGVQDESLLLCNSAGLQIRKCVEIQPDALVAGSRYNAEHTLLGNLESTIKKLTGFIKESPVYATRKIGHLQVNLQEAPSPSTNISRDCSHRRRSSYMTWGSPQARRRSTVGGVELFLPQVDDLDDDEFIKATDALWGALHKGNWKALRAYDKLVHAHDHTSAPGTVHPATVLEELSKLRFDSKDELWKDAVVAVDVGDITLWASLCMTLGGGSRTLYSERLGTMGYALNAGIAGILCKEAPAGAIVLAGDGGFQMSLQELATFQQMKRPGDKMMIIVFDNELLGRVLYGFDGALGCEIKGADYVMLSQAFGGQGARLDDVSRVKDVLKQGMEFEGMFIIHVIVDHAVKADVATFKDKTLAVMNSG